MVDENAPTPNAGLAMDAELLASLGAAAEEQERQADEPFPATWNPAKPEHPNPLVMAAFPAIVKPETAADPLIEATHVDGRVFTIWLSTSLVKHLVRAGVREGMPCSIKRGERKRQFTAADGAQRSA